MVTEWQAPGRLSEASCGLRSLPSCCVMDGLFVLVTFLAVLFTATHCSWCLGAAVSGLASSARSTGLVSVGLLLCSKCQHCSHHCYRCGSPDSARKRKKPYSQTSPNITLLFPRLSARKERETTESDLT
ncbi:hypothetical protein E2C01_058533 [Portunus trituberculatus]|uniref:Uncharacterized protein n=1 Tax=Portunus trituberculatus TaxID=210409 RepID=A0A5B7H4Y6_PORTR|nr:hypothetical protein [Portunus trituberculatus]